MQVSINVNVTPPRWLHTKTRRKAVALALAAALAIPGLALAAHSFSDVPDSNAFHTNISRVYGARITNGCTATTYCPAANVTREQMAAFLARSGGRVASTTITNAIVPVAYGTIGTLAIKAGDVTGGTAYVKVDFAFRTVAFNLACPCDGVVYIHDANGLALAWTFWSLPSHADSLARDSSAVSVVVSVPTGVTTTFTIHAKRDTGTSTNIAINGTATATYFPVGGAGENAPAP